MRKVKGNFNKYRGSDIARLDFHRWDGTVYDRTRAPTGDKVKGVLMIDKIEDRFNLSPEEIIRMKEEIREKSLKELEEMEKLHKTPKLKFVRDERGNIVSPFNPRYKELKEKQESESQ